MAFATTGPPNLGTRVGPIERDRAGAPAADLRVPCVIAEWVDRRPDAVALRMVGVTGTELWTYRRLWERVCLIRDGAFGDLPVGSRVLMAQAGDADYVAGFIAALDAGLIPVPLYLPAADAPDRFLRRAQHIVRDCAPAAVYTSTDLVEALDRDPLLDAIALRTPDSRTGGGRRPPGCDGRFPGEVAFLQYTSGSTGEPKGIVNTHESMLHQRSIGLALWNRPEDIRTVSWLPLYHDLGIFWGVLLALATGGTATVIPPFDFVRNPRLWLQTVSAVRGNWIAGPDFAYRLCIDAFDDATVESLDLSCLRVAINGAEPVRPATLSDFVAKFRPAGLRADAMAPQYGLAEAGLAVSGTTSPRAWVQASFDAEQLNRGRAVKARGVSPATRRTHTLVSCGDSSLGWDVRIVDPQRRRNLPDGEVGEIWVGGTGLPLGYWGRPEQTAETFGATMADGRGPYLRTGDAGFRCDGELYICGRYRDLIIVGGGNYFPNDIELTVEESGCKVDSGGACAVQPPTVPDEWWLVVETDSPAGNLDELSRLLQRRIVAAHQTAPHRIVWVRPRVLPRTTSGKIRRRKTLELLETGQLPIVQQVSAQPAATELAEQVAGLLGLRVGDLERDSDLIALGLTSMMTVQVVEWAATRARQLDFADLYAQPTLGSWQRLYDAATTPCEQTPAAFDGSLTGLQRAYWIGRGTEQPLGGVGCQTYFELVGGAVDPGRLDTALDLLAQRHPMLRSMFPDADRYRIAPRTIHTPLQVHDLTNTTDATRDRHLGGVRSRLRTHRFDIGIGDTWRVELTRLDHRCILHVAIDLIIADLTSIGIFLHDLAALYRGDELPEAPAGPAIAARAAPLCGEIEQLPEGPQLPGAEEHDIEFRRAQYVLDAGLLAALDETCRTHGVTRAAMFLAAYVLVLRRWSATPDFLINVTTFGRPPGAVDVIGDFTKTRLYRTGIEEHNAFADHARGVQRGLRAALAGPESTDLLAAQLQAGTGHSGLAPVVFTYAADTGVLQQHVTETLGAVSEVTSMTPQVTIDNQVGSLGEGVLVSWDYRAGCFPPGVVADMFAAYVNLIERLSAQDWATPALIDLPEHSRLIRRKRNGTTAEQPPGLLYDAFREQARRNPADVALHWAADEFDREPLGDPIAGAYSRLSYGELDVQARRVAGALAARHAPGSIIGIQLPKGPTQVVAVLGVLMSGCGYLPIGVDQPAERFARICARSAMSGLIRAAPRIDDPAGDGPVVYGIESMLESAPVAPIPADPADTAYVIYTSGSTGEPKGVLVSHAAALNTIVDVNRRNGIAGSDVVLALSALDFDLSVYDIFGPLSCGAGLVCISEASRRDAFRWTALMAEFSVTVWNSVPALLDMLLTAGGESEAALPTLRSVFLSGDWIPLDMPRRLRDAAPGARLVAMGGATEASIWSNEFVVSHVDPGWPSIPYGYPLSNQMFRVVDDKGEDCPDYVAGELWIGGAGVAQGYHRAPELTAERFVADALEHRWYRTGDLGCYWPDGTLQFLGRFDAQVKIGGHRVECGEIEHALRGHPQVNDAVVVPIHGNRALGAVVVCVRGVAQANVSGLRVYLASRLPHYMIPTSFVFRSELPLTGNGKIDRRRAAAEIGAGTRAEGAGPQPAGALNPVEKAVAGVWSEVLGTPITNRDDNFFRHGGDSLRATRVVLELKRNGVHGAEVGQLLGRQTLGAFSSVCFLGSPADDPADDCVAAGATEFALTRLQQAYVLGMAGLNGSVKAPTSFAVTLAGDDIDPDRFATVVDRCADEFAMLRCALDTDTRQRVHARAAPVTVTVVAGTHPDVLMQHMVGAPCDPRAVPAVQCFALSGSSHYIGLLINYLSLDARSLATVVAAIVADYQRVPRPFQVDCGAEVFARFAGEVRPNGSGHEYSPPPALPLRDPRPDPAARVSFTRSSFTLDADDFDRLRERAARLCVTPAALIFEAFGQALHSMGAGRRFAIVVPKSYRPGYAPAGREVLGNFTRLALCDIDYRVAQPGSHAAVTAAQQQLWRGDGDATAHLAGLRAAGSAGYPVVFTSTLGLIPQGPAALSSIRTLTQTPGVWLDCQVEDDMGGARISWDVAGGWISEAPLAAAFSLFEHLVRRDEPPAPPGGADWAAAVVAAAASLCPSERIRPQYAALVRHWEQAGDTVAPQRDTARAARRLADIVTGAASPQTLIGDPQLAPEALLLADERLQRALGDLSERIFGHARRIGRRLRIMELGSRTGLISRRLADLIGTVVDEHLCFEPNPVLARIAAERNGETVGRQILSAGQIGATEVDVVVCCGSLHQLADPGGALDAVAVADDGWLWVAEICDITAATLASAAVLNPGLLSEGALPAADQWWRFIAQRQWRPVQMTQDGPGLTVVAHPRGGAPPPQVAPPAGVALPNVVPAGRDAVDESALATIAGIWRRHLDIAGDIAGSGRPGVTDDFFLLGGDSLVATRVYADLQAAGFERLALVDLFNYPILGDLAAHLGAPTGPRIAQQQAVIEPRDESSFPLTVVQQAYLAGRFGGFVLSGVAAHCYFEFDVHQFDRAKFERAARQLIERHPGLRTTVLAAEPSRWVAVVHPAPIEPVVCDHDDVRARMLDQVIDVTTRPGIDFGVQTAERGRGVVGISMDNIMLDGASMMLALAQLDYLYRGGDIDELPSQQTSFGRYVRNHPELWVDADETALPRLAVSRDYWRARLPSLPPAPRLAPMQVVLDVERPVFERVEATVGRRDWGRITQACRTRRVTPAAFLMAHYARVLAQWSGTDHFCVNVTLFDRDPGVPGINDIIGDFTSLLLVECHVDPTASIWDQARRVQQQVITDLPHRAADAVWLQRELLRHHGRPAEAVFPVVFTSGLGLVDASGDSGFEFGQLVFGISQTPQTLLDFQMWENAGSLSLSWDFVTQAIPADVARRNLDVMVEAIIAADVAGPALPRDADDDLTEKVLRICASSLDVPRVELWDNFFQLGGDSVTATRVVERLSREVPAGATLRLLFENPVIGDFATQLRAVAANTAAEFEEGLL